MLLIAIDPGASGGIAIMGTSGRHNRVTVTKMPPARLDVYRYLRGVAALNESFVLVEQIATAAFGNASPAGISALNRNAENILLSLEILGVGYREVHPKTWMKPFNLPADKAERKRAIRDQMQALYPKVKVTLWNADALAILTWGMTFAGDKKRKSVLTPPWSMEDLMLSQM